MLSTCAPVFIAARNYSKKLQNTHNGPCSMFEKMSIGCSFCNYLSQIDIYCAPFTLFSAKRTFSRKKTFTVLPFAPFYNNTITLRS